MTSLKYRQEHREELRQKAKLYYQNNKEQCNIRQKRWYQKHKDSILQKYKTVYRLQTNIRRKKLKELFVDMLGGKCQICGYNKSLVALDFHHIDNSKEKRSEPEYKSLFLQRIKNNKVQLLCANCHREIHNKR